MSKKRSSKKAGVKLLATLLCVLLFLLLFAQSASAAPLGPGDINSDGRIDVRDVTLVQRHVLGLSLLTDAQKALAIVKGFGTEPDARDVVLIMQRSIGKISTFPLPPTVTSPAFSTLASNNVVTITLTGGTFKAGAITAADFTFAGGNASALATGTFSRTSDTVVTITGLTLAAATNNTVTVKEATMATRASSVAAAASTTPAVTSPAFPTAAGDNRVTITLTGGTFKTGTITAADFTFAGSNAAALAAGTFSRTSDMVVTVTTTSPLVADTSNTVSVKATAMAIQASSVAAVASKIESVSTTFSSVVNNNTVTITLTGGIFKAGAITAADFTFSGSNAAALAVSHYTRISDTQVAITVPATLAAAPNSTTVTVKATAMATQATSVAAVASTIPQLATTPATFATLLDDNTVTITLTGATFRAGTLTAADFTFDGDNAVLMAVGSFTRTSDTVVSITVLTPLAAANNNEIVIKASAMASQSLGASATAVASKRTAVTSPAYNTGSTNTKIAITLTGGTFKAGTITAADFTFTGANATALAAGNFTRTSDTVVTVTVAAPLAAATNNTVTVKAATMATQASLVTVVPSD